MLEQEHKCYPLGLKLLAEGKVHMDGNRAHVDATASGGLNGSPIIR